MLSLARKYKCAYTRYADDITFSTNLPRFPQAVASVSEQGVVVGDDLGAAVASASFVINTEKVRYASPSRRQEVTGITVNEFSNVRRGYIRQLRSILHAWDRHGEKAAEQTLHSIILANGKKSTPQIKNYVRGKIAYLNMVRGQDDPVVRNIVYEYIRVSQDQDITWRDIKDVEPQPLRGAMAPPLVWQEWYRRLSHSVMLIETNNKNGDKESGTAFKIGKKLLATAGHNLAHDEVKVWIGQDLCDSVKLASEVHDRGRDVGLLSVYDIADNIRCLETQCRIPEVGEQLAAIGFPAQPLRDSTQSISIGIVESLPVGLGKDRFIQVSFHSAPGLSGAPLIDRCGFVVGIMTENTGNPVEHGRPVPRAFAQAVPMEYLRALKRGCKAIAHKHVQSRVISLPHLSLTAPLSHSHTTLESGATKNQDTS